MKEKMLFVLLLGCTLYSQETIKPDLALERIVTDTYHGVTLEDPYRYMENLEDPDVVNWMKSNADYAQSVLDDIPGKETLFNTIKEMIGRKAATISKTVITDDDTYYYVKRQPGEEIGKVYQRKGYTGKEILFFDPNTYNPSGEEGTVYTVSVITPNSKGDIIAIGVEPGGSENTDVIFFDKGGKRYPDKLELALFFDWAKTDNTVLYNKLNSPDLKDANRQLATKVFAHKIGSEPSSDRDFFSSTTYPDLEIKDREFPIVICDKSSNRIYGLAVTVDKSIKAYISNNSLYYDKEWKNIVDMEDNVYEFYANGEDIYYLTFKDAPNFKIVKASLNQPEFKKGVDAVHEHSDEIINGFRLTKDGLYYHTTKNGVEANVYFLKHGAEEALKLDLPFAAGFAELETKSPEFSEIWITIEGWISPAKRFRYDPETNSFTHEPLSTPTTYPELDDLVVKEITVTSHDGTKVPVSIVHNKNLKLDGENPAMIFGYGSYGISMEPFFSPITLAYVTQGGVLVVPHVRGGGELGDSWHRAGQKLNKPNTWKDGIATAEYLINEGYTNNKKLSIFGGSAGGIFVGRSVTERPDLFVAGAPLVGAMNTVRFESSPNGPVNSPEFGTVKDPDEFKGLLEMDAFHHLKKDTDYPAMLITSGFNDSRVSAWEPAKFAAKMQRYQGGKAPILFLTYFDEGHGGRTTLTNQINQFANVFSFFYWQSGHPDFQPVEKSRG